MSVQRAATPTQIKDSKRNSVLAAKQNRDDLSKILATPEGERYIIRLLTRCTVLRSGYESNGSKAYFEAGMRHVGTMIATEVAAIAPQVLTKVLTPLALAPDTERDDDETRENDDHRD